MKPIIGLALLTSLIGCTKIEEPQFRRIEDFKLQNVSLTDATIGFATAFYNPNNFSVQLKEAQVDVYIDSMYIGKFVQPLISTANAKQDFSVPFQGSISLASAIKLNLPKLLNKEVLIKAAGSVKIGKAGVFITKDFSYQGKQKLDPTLLKIQP